MQQALQQEQGQGQQLGQGMEQQRCRGAHHQQLLVAQTSRQRRHQQEQQQQVAGALWAHQQPWAQPQQSLMWQRASLSQGQVGGWALLR
jgi:hypothetical protein